MFFELRRKFFHIATGLLIVLLLAFEFAGTGMLLFFVAYSIFLGLISRYWRPPFFILLLERDENLKKFPCKGAIYFMISCLFLWLIFPRNIALASMMVLSLADAISNLAGKAFGRIKHPFSSVKCIEGHIAGTIVGGSGASFFIPPSVAYTATAIAMFIEGVDMKSAAFWFDDNFTVPLTAGAVSYFLLDVSRFF